MSARPLIRFAAGFQAALLLASLLLPGLVAAATIQTDLWVYQDGDTVTVTGVDFGANEVVDFVTSDPAGVVVDTGSASTDELGNVTYHVLWGLAIVTMFVGNAFALVQKNIKRMLAYSSIAHTGYLLVAIIALPDGDAAAAIMYYLVAYAFTNLGALACISFLNGKQERFVNIDDFAGAAWKYPLVGLGMAVCMFSLIGFPPTAGFFAKYYLFIAAFKADMAPLVIVAIVNSILSVFYYLRVVVVMYMRDDVVADDGVKPALPTKIAIIYTSVAVIWAGMGTISLTGLLPGAGPLLASAKASAMGLLTPGGNPPPAAMR
jgi:formate hydrogenlyase subunit 3/multisubunit Na+/H+ antiporter MnhD subunit